MRTITFSLLTAFLMAIMAVAHAQDGTTVSRVTLPVDQKLVDVSWRCGRNGACVPWFLTRLIGRKEAMRSYTFTDGTRTILVTETRGPGNWPWDRVRSVALAAGQRLLEVSWRCGADGCTPWFLTAPIEGRAPRTHVFTDGRDVILIEETPLE